jgi:hypothetical protein
VTTPSRWWWARGWRDSWAIPFYAWLHPSAAAPSAWRLFAFALPAIFYLCYFLALMLTEGIAWSVHLWVGSIVLAGIAGWLLSYLLLPPRSSEDRL